MTKKRATLNAFFTAVIFGAVGTGAIHALIVLAAAFPLLLGGVTYTLVVVGGGSVDQVHGAEWAAFFPAIARHLAIFGVCAVAFVTAGYGAHRTVAGQADCHQEL
ncbi:hypothetical protein [Prescottella equi]